VTRCSLKEGTKHLASSLSIAAVSSCKVALCGKCAISTRNAIFNAFPLRFWVTIDGRKLAKPLEHGDTCLIGVKPGRHIVDVKMPYTGLVNLDKKLETRELEPGEMQVIEMAICGLTIPYTKVRC